MDRRRARLLAVSASTVFAIALFIVVRPLFRGDEAEQLRIHRLQPPLLPQGPPRTDVDAASDATVPEQWRYYLTEEEANALFAFRGDVRMAYDPWVYFRDAGNLEDTFKRREHPDRQWTWKTNSLGCREDHELDDPPRELRVLVAGDSHTCGLCDDDESFANLLEAAIARERAPKTVEVLNAGLGGYTFHNYFGTLLRFRAFAPRVFVVAVFGGNDFVELLPLDFHFKRRPWDSLSREAQARRDAAMEISREALGQGFNQLDTFRAWPQEAPTMVREAIDLCSELGNVAAQHGSRMIVVFIPSPFDFEWRRFPGRAADVRAALALSDAEMQVNRQMGSSFLAGLEEAGVQALDMGPIFEREPDPPYWLVDFHIDLRGQALIAEALKPLVDAALDAR
ncbi:MAG TPA: SGNH/GDSL hydrolase family protein [Planctomycetota bacterium]|nr:SGNH/GDSL hydrolase family protein [Planctomycetota bacterium]